MIRIHIRKRKIRKKRKPGVLCVIEAKWVSGRWVSLKIFFEKK